MIEDFRRREAGCQGLEDPGSEDEPVDDDDDDDDDSAASDDGGERDGGANKDAGNGALGEFDVLVRRSAMSFTASRLEVPTPSSRQGQRCGTPLSSSSFTATLSGCSSWRQLPLGPEGSRGGATSASQVPLFDEDAVTRSELASAGSFRANSSGGSSFSGSGGRAGPPARPMTAARQRPIAGTPLAPTPRAAPRDNVVSSGSGTTAADPASSTNSSSCSGGARGSVSISVSGGGGGSIASGGTAGGGTRNPALMLKMIEAAAASQAARRSSAAPSAVPSSARGVQRSCPNLSIPQSFLEEAAEDAAAAPEPDGTTTATTSKQRSAGAASKPASPAGSGIHSAAMPSSPPGGVARGMLPGRAPSRLGMNVATAPGGAEDAGAGTAGTAAGAVGVPSSRGGGTLNGYGCSPNAINSAPGLSFIIPQPLQPQQPQQSPSNSSSNALLGGGAPLTSCSGEAAFLTDGEDGLGPLSPPVRRLRSITAAAGTGTGTGTSGSLSALMGGVGSGGVGCGSRPVTPGTGVIAVNGPSTADSWRTRQLSPGGKLLHVQATRPPSRRSIDAPFTAVGPLSPMGLGGRITRGSASFDQGSRPLTPAASPPGGPAAASLNPSGGVESPFSSRITPAPGGAEACGGGAGSGSAGFMEPGACWRGSASSRSFTSVKAGGGALSLAPAAAPSFGRSSSPAAPFAGGGSVRGGLLQPLATTAGSGSLDPISELVADSEDLVAACNTRAVPPTPPTPSPDGSGACGRAAPTLLAPHPPAAPPPPPPPGGPASLLGGTSRRSLQARAALLCPSPSGSYAFERRSEASSLKSCADGNSAGTADKATADKAAGSLEQGPGTPVPSSAGSRPGVMERLRGLFV